MCLNDSQNTLNWNRIIGVLILPSTLLDSFLCSKKTKHNEKVQNTKEKCELFLIVSLLDDDFFPAVDTFAVETCKEIRFYFCIVSIEHMKEKNCNHRPTIKTF